MRDDIEQYATVEGNRFLVVKPIDTPERPISVVINWPSAIK